MANVKNLVQNLLRPIGYRIQRIRTPFVPFVRDFNFPEASFRMWIGNPDSVWWFDEAHWKKCGEYRALRDLVKSGDRVLEIGSHQGFTGMLLANFVGQTGFILGVEAYPENAMIAQAQLALNPSLVNLQFIHAACANVPGKAIISHSHNSSVNPPLTADTIEVVAVTGDMLDQEQTSRHGSFDVIKLDVEGYELEVLKGCTKLLARAPKLALEIHIDSLRERGHSVGDVFKLINAGQYEGEMVVRPDDFDKVQVFDPSAFPQSGVVNVFLKKRRM